MTIIIIYYPICIYYNYVIFMTSLFSDPDPEIRSQIRAIPHIIDGFNRCTFEERTNVQFIYGFINSIVANEDLFAIIFDSNKSDEIKYLSYSFNAIVTIVNTIVSIIDVSIRHLLDFTYIFYDDHHETSKMTEFKLHHSHVCTCNEHTPLNMGFVAGLKIIYPYFLESFEPDPPLKLTDGYVISGPDMFLTSDFLSQKHSKYEYMHDFGSISMRLVNSNIITSSLYRHGNRVFCLVFTQITKEGHNETLGLIQIDIREGVDINKCFVNFTCIKCRTKQHIFNNNYLHMIPHASSKLVEFKPYDCQEALHIIGITLNAGGHFVTKHNDFSKLTVVDSEGQNILMINGSALTYDMDMPGVVAGYTESWITSSNTHTQIRSVDIVRPILQKDDSDDDDDDYRQLYYSLMRRQPHIQFAKQYRTDEANQPCFSLARVAWMSSIIRITNRHPTPS